MLEERARADFQRATHHRPGDALTAEALRDEQLGDAADFADCQDRGVCGGEVVLQGQQAVGLRVFQVHDERVDELRGEPRRGFRGQLAGVTEARAGRDDPQPADFIDRAGGLAGEVHDVVGPPCETASEEVIDQRRRPLGRERRVCHPFADARARGAEMRLRFRNRIRGRNAVRQCGVEDKVRIPDIRQARIHQGRPDVQLRLIRDLLRSAVLAVGCNGRIGRDMTTR